MKKSFILFVSVIMSCLFLFAFFGCSTEPKSYEGTEVVKITYSRVDYFGGYTEDYLLDFTSNTASKRGYMPPHGDNDIPEYQQFAEFTDSEAKVFFDKCYTHGLFSLKESYASKGTIHDGGGWSLTIEYVDETTFSSKGSNAGPSDVFRECKYAFYDLCGDGVVGSIPSEYMVPPDISLTFTYHKGIDNYSTNALARISRGNYLWNGHSVTETSYYEVNQELSKSNKFDGTCQYDLVLYTSNYDYSRKFNKLTVTCYDYNEEMSNEQMVFSSAWFKQKEFPLQFDKIYIYRLYWSDGDFAEYTFNTKLYN